MPLAAAIFFSFCLLAICVAAPISQLPRPATVQIEQFFNETMNATSGRSAPPVFHEESATILKKTVESQNSTEHRPGVAVETAKGTSEYQNTFTSNSFPAGSILVKFQHLNLPNWEKTEEGRSSAPERPVAMGKKYGMQC